MASNEWELELMLRRSPGQRDKGDISEEEAISLYNELVDLAYRKGYTLSGLVPRAKRTNCPHCGRIIRGLSGKTRCPMCGGSLTRLGATKP